MGVQKSSCPHQGVTVVWQVARRKAYPRFWDVLIVHWVNGLPGRTCGLHGVLTVYALTQQLIGECMKPYSLCLEPGGLILHLFLAAGVAQG